MSLKSYIIIATWLKLPLLYGERTHLCGHYIYFYGLSTFRGLDNGISPYLSCDSDNIFIFK